MTSGNISESPEHSIKLEYELGGKLLQALWEPKDGGYTLQTIFDKDGGILDQKLINLQGHDQKEVVEAFMDSNDIEPKESVYEPVALHKECPSCHRRTLVRRSYIEKKPSKIPIMPMYECTNCGSKAYYLTDWYLKKLVVSNKELFEGVDIKEFETDEQKFINELKAYIIRIFASKHVLNIK
ncbi:MAG: hypothetical protein QW814_00160 [Methanothrix sp.]